MSDRRPAIVGVGNVLMGDDGVGPAALDALRRAGAGDRAELIDAGLAFSEVLCDLTPEKPMIVVDAVRGQGEPGSIYRLTPADLDPETGAMTAAMSLHEVNVLPALRMEALAGRRFHNVTIYGVEPGKLDWGEGLSGPVAEAVEKLVEIVCRHLDEFAAVPAPIGTTAACGSEDR